MVLTGDAVKVARAVAALPALEVLLLDENEISAAGVAQVKVNVLVRVRVVLYPEHVS